MQLEIRHPDGKTKRLALNPEAQLRFGAHPSADVTLNAPGIKPIHLGIVFRRGHFQAVPSKAAGRFRCNGVEVTRAELKPGDEIALGPFRLLLVDDESELSREAAGLEPLEREDLYSDDLETDAAVGADPLGIDDLTEDGPESLDPLGDLPDEPAGSPLDSASPLGVPGAPRAKQKKKKEKKTKLARPERVGPSPLQRVFSSRAFRISLAGVSSVALLVLAIILVMAVPTPVERFREADRMFERGQFVEATDHFAKLSRRSDGDVWGDDARVKREVAQLLRAADGQPRPEDALEDLHGAWARLGSQARHPSAQTTLAELGSATARALLRETQLAAERGNLADARGHLTNADKMLKLIRKHVPPALRHEHEVNDVELEWARLDRELERPDTLRVAMDDIAAASRQGEFREVYDVRSQLLLDYPTFASSGQLLAAMRRAAEQEALRVQIEISKQSPVQEETSAAVELLFMPWDRSVAQAEVRSFQVVGIYAPEHGVVYALEAATGRPLWQRSVGMQTTFDPIVVSESSSAGIVCVDSHDWALIRVEALTGKLVWRQPVVPFSAPPVIVDEIAIVAGRDGTVLEIDLNSGDIVRRYITGQRLTVAPAVDADTIYQLADHSLIYALPRKSRPCEIVRYMGHEAGMVPCRPIRVGKYLAVVTVESHSVSTVQFLDTEEELQIRQSVSVPGEVLTMVGPVRNRLFVAVADGRLMSIAFDTTERRPFRDAEDMIHVTSSSMSASWFATGKKDLWMAGRGLRRFVFDARQDRFVQQNQWDSGQQFVAAPRLSDKGAVSVSRAGAEPGLKVVSRRSGEWTSVWEGRIAVPPATMPVRSSGGTLLLLLADGSYLRIPATVDESGAPERIGAVPVSQQLRRTAVQAPPAVATCIGMRGMAAVLCLDSDGNTKEVPLPQPLACAPVRVGDQLVVALENGPLLVIRPESGKIVGQPWLPRIATDRPPQWQGILASAADEVLVFDVHGSVFQLGIDPNAEQPLVLRREAALPTDVAAEPVKTDETVWWRDGQGRLVAAPLAEPSSASVANEDQVVWGPHVLAGRVLAVTANGQLRAFEEPSASRWQLPLPSTSAVGACIHNDRMYVATSSALLVATCIHNDRMYVATSNGLLLSVDPESGETDGEPIRLNLPLAAGPCSAGGKLLVVGSDGSLYAVLEENNAN